ncbi:uncharacterized protein LOC109140341 [Larimichthys crocea]|uniref:uncharacterized protein LOC109140341 n=1 Tax=Larimichthys crocea TaxID=215358 RepID=UPI000F60103E|nr:uncharacterized protein LOC109140341 [Larimichthys crocea]XP_027141580.1 uncharacterized protein LOC109140341 [Larimichthys crocea]XP_027141581.1 uncharacterized protein LOC109140341 [Larimichthys crocea]XP_027141582.1 uncharacterized protein LOC109140341 [Larimichthys crocea]XP_027141583.1 uncharacterized protein LOC109140341 [Larimichthys crocea]
MGYVCFKCKRSLGTDIRQFFFHLKVMHNILSTSIYFQCAQVGCHRSFDNQRSFRRHLMGHSFDFDVESVEEGSLAQFSDWSISPDPEPNVLGEVECSETAVEEWDELPDESIKDRVALFLARLKAKSSHTFSGIRDVVEHTSSLIKDIVDGLKRRTVSLLRETGHSETPKAEELLEQFETAAEPFRGFESEYRQIKFFTQSGYFVQPEALPLPGFSYIQETDRETGTVKQVAVRDTFQYVPLKAMLKLVLESPGTMAKILEWRNNETTALEDLRDGTLFRTNHLFSEELSIPIVIYVDDCEMVNPLGSKTSVHKLGFIYFTIKCLPPEYLSSLKSHFLLAVYKSNDVKHYGGMNVVLDPIVNEIRDMEQNGIQIEARHFSGTVKVGLAQVCGDNLGLNSILSHAEFVGFAKRCYGSRLLRTLCYCVIRSTTSQTAF